MGVKSLVRLPNQKKQRVIRCKTKTNKDTSMVFIIPTRNLTESFSYCCPYL